MISDAAIASIISFLTLVWTGYQQLKLKEHGERMDDIEQKCEDCEYRKDIEEIKKLPTIAS